jgi:SAM-dependent methyltransferase
MSNFYDQLAPLYHLIYEDWDAAIARQGEQLARIIQNHWPNTKTILDVSCGIGTQAIGLAKCGFQFTGSDLSPGAIDRARTEASARNVNIPFSVCDMLNALQQHTGRFDVVISADNSLPHLLSDEQILIALREMRQCLRPGGGCLVSIRDYDTAPRGENIMVPCGVRSHGTTRTAVFQIWDFAGDQYDLTLCFVEEDLQTREVRARSMRSTYRAISLLRLRELMIEAGFNDVRRLDGVFFQPVLIGTR